MNHFEKQMTFATVWEQEPEAPSRFEVQTCRWFWQCSPARSPAQPCGPVLVQRGAQMSQQTWSFQPPVSEAGLILLLHSLEMCNNHIDESETKLWHPLWNNIEWLFPHSPVSESLLFLCTSLWLHQDNSAVQALCFFTWGHHSWQEMNTALISCLCLVWRCFIFRGEKATLSFHRINHFKIFQSDNHNSLHFTVFNKKHIHTPKAEYTILPCHHDQTSHFKSDLGLFYCFG